MSKVGRPLGHRLSDETKRKIGEGNRGNPNGTKGRYRRTAKHKLLQSERGMGNKNALGHKHGHDAKLTDREQQTCILKKSF